MVIWGLPPMSVVWDMSINAWVIIGVSFTYVSVAVTQSSSELESGVKYVCLMVFRKHLNVT